jgi:hypothetical protein
VTKQALQCLSSSVSLAVSKLSVAGWGLRRQRGSGVPAAGVRLRRVGT